MMKEFLHSVPDWKQNGVSVPDEFVKQLVEMDASLRQVAAASVVLVTYEIRISP